MLFLKPLLQSPEKIFFHSEDQIRSYHKKQLKKLESVFVTNFQTPEKGYFDTHSTILNPVPHLTLKTSGTTTGGFKQYEYDWENYYLIEKYHIQRIRCFNDISKRNTVKLTEIAKNADEDEEESGYEPIGLSQLVAWDSSTGMPRNTYHLKYNLNDGDEEFWMQEFKKMDYLDIGTIYCRPAEYYLFKSILPKIGPRNYHIIFTGEVLPYHLLEDAKLWFKGVIDKMRCWDGGLSFFQCRYGTKHINDELSMVENVDNKLISTDFFNHAQLFYKYWNGDCGEIEMKQCDCGIFGSTLKTLQGREIECIVTHNNIKIPGTIIVNTIMALVKALNLNNLGVQFHIHQYADKSVVFHFSHELSKEESYKVICNFNEVVKQYDTKPIEVRFNFQKKYALFNEHHRVKKLLTTSDVLLSH